MKRCIYLKGSEPELSFHSEEHIFPAGIGGIQKLPKGYVSDQFNTEIFSKIELEFMRNSLISLPRMFYGPGKRGSINEKYATKSNVTLFTPREDSPMPINFGYLKLGKPYNIPQLLLRQDGTINLSLNSDDGDYIKQLNALSEALENFSNKYILFLDDKFDEGELLLGLYEGKWFLGSKTEELTSKITEWVEKIVTQRPFENPKPTYGKSQQTVHQKMHFDINNYFRTCAKIAFNYLAFIKGQDFALQECFDPLRNWIVHGGENKFAFLIEREENGRSLHDVPFPQNSHKVLISKKSSNTLVANISFYGAHFETGVYLSDTIDQPFELEGYICDWSQRKELSFLGFLQLLANENQEE